MLAKPKGCIATLAAGRKCSLACHVLRLINIFFKDYNMLLIVNPGEAGLGARSHLHCFPARLNNSLKITGASVSSSAQWG